MIRKHKPRERSLGLTNYKHVSLFNQPEPEIEYRVKDNEIKPAVKREDQRKKYFFQKNTRH